MGRSLSGRGAGGFDGPLLPAPLIAKPDQARRAAREGLRRQRHTGKQIAAEVGVSAATVSRVLKRLGLNRLSALEPAEPIRRYERAAPGEIVHIDIKKLGKFNRIGHRITGDRTGQSNTRGVGWEYVHLAIDDHSRLAYSEILPDEKRTSCLRFLFNALRYFRSLGVKVERVMTDNGSSFRSRRYAKALRRLRIRHLRTKPYTPKTNGKAERFVQTSLREWAYARAYDTSDQRLSPSADRRGTGPKARIRFRALAIGISFGSPLRALIAVWWCRTSSDQRIYRDADPKSSP